MSLAATLDRIAELQTLLRPAAAPVAPATAAQATTFSGQLSTAAGASPLATASALPATGGTAAARAARAAAQAEVGVAEQPPGSNDSPRIATYRQATAGAPGPGPWCAYFASWACKQAGVPLMDGGAGSGSVDAIYAWAQRNGRAQPASSSYTPRPGDLIVFNEHIGLVENVLPDGRLQTIEGNSSDRVSRRTHARSEAIGFVRTT